MKWRLRSEVRRCRPLLGTFVEIIAGGIAEDLLHAALDSAFVAIDRIQRLMSAHDPASELSRLNAEAFRHPVVVSAETFIVLRRALDLSAESRGAFDPTIAPILAHWGLLPARLKRKRPGSWLDVSLLPGRKVRFSRPLTLDLGGIAKGFAIDAAIETLRAAGARSATVNAGGDLRVFGSPINVHIRHPAAPQLLSQRIELSEGALATSCPCFTQHFWRRCKVSHLVDPRCGTATTRTISVSVRAPECWLADGLTKVVLYDPKAARGLLAKYGAQALVLTA